MSRREPQLYSPRSELWGRYARLAERSDEDAASRTWRGLSDYRDTSAEPILQKRDDTENARRMI
jgi:hypothetical protein